MKALYFFSVLVILASCVNNKQIIYLQDQDSEDKDLPKDTIVRSIDLKPFEYKLSVDDVVSIEVSSLSPPEYNVFTHPDSQNKSPLLSGYIVDKEGNVELPIIGKVRIEGLSVPEAQALVQSKIANYLSSPIVNLKLLTYKVTVLGEVNQPGTYSSYTNSMNVFDAVGLAGDLTDVANRANVKLVRYDSGKANIVYLNLLDDKMLNSDYYYLLPNDILVVPPLRVKNIRQYQLQNFGILLSTLTVISLLLIRL